jgi:hypothetical protein
MIPLRPLLSLLSLASTALAIGQNATIAFNASAGSHELASGGSSVQIMADTNDWPAVLKAANDLSQDFGRVTGSNGSVILSNASDTSGVPAFNAGSYFSGNPNNASMIFNITGLTTFSTTGPGTKGGVIIAGTIGNSSLIDALIKSGKIDVSAINGTWEAFTSTVVSNPINGVHEALVIAGSDRRGTVYGLYDVSEQIGVSPWYFWADSPPQKHDCIYAMNTTKVQPSPSVKYRGFFLNDEAPALTGYVNEKFGFNQYGSNYGADFYHTVFELLLRLRANYLWPAQWNSMFNVDDPRSQNMADAYGIVMGTSHTEPMMRSTKEWNEFGNGTWSWATCVDSSSTLTFWSHANFTFDLGTMLLSILSSKKARKDFVRTRVSSPWVCEVRVILLFRPVSRPNFWRTSSLLSATSSPKSLVMPVLWILTLCHSCGVWYDILFTTYLGENVLIVLSFLVQRSSRLLRGRHDCS